MNANIEIYREQMLKAKLFISLGFISVKKTRVKQWKTDSF